MLDTKIKIPEDVFNDLMTWRSESFKWPRTPKFVGTLTLNELSLKATDWWSSNRVSDEENNQRLIAIIRWVNGEDIFEIETNNKWIVRSKEKDDRGKYFYVSVSKDGVWFSTTTEICLAKKFDSKEEADKYTNVLTESVQYK